MILNLDNVLGFHPSCQICPALLLLEKIKTNPKWTQINLNK